MKVVDAKELNLNPFSAFADQWGLVTAGNEEKCNTMTVSWGGVGFFWNKNTATIYIRPQRYTKEFIDSQDCFSISFLPEEYRNALKICGKETGRDGDKFEKAGITKAFEDGIPYVKEANLVFFCKKLCEGDIDPESFQDKNADEQYYPQKDYHRYYIASIEKVLQKD